MATSKTRKKSSVKKSPVRKSAVPEAPTSGTADSDAPALARMRASQPRLSDVEVSAFRSLVSDADCRARGVLTRAAETHRDVARALTRGRVDAVVRDHGAALGYDGARLAFLLDLTAAVGDAVAEQKKARGAGADRKFTVEQSGRAATAARNALLRRPRPWPGVTPTRAPRSTPPADRSRPRSPSSTPSARWRSSVSPG